MLVRVFMYFAEFSYSGLPLSEPEAVSRCCSLDQVDRVIEEERGEMESFSSSGAMVRLVSASVVSIRRRSA